jgi:hypothetical protein
LDGEEAAVELSEGRGAFTELIGRRVRDRSGRSLGHVFEARAHWEADGTIVIDEPGRSVGTGLSTPDTKRKDDMATEKQKAAARE